MIPEAIPRFGRPAPDLPIVDRRAAYALIRDQIGRVLTVQTARGLFLPGGGLEEGESTEQAVAREAREELCRELVTLEYRGGAVQHFIADGVSYAMHAEFFVASVGDRLPGAPEYHIEWVDPTRPQRWYHRCHEWAARTL
jgi:8-oxo-dGTP diphosphatase